MKLGTSFTWFVRAYLVAALGGAASLLAPAGASAEAGTTLPFVGTWAALYLGTILFLQARPDAFLRRSERLVYLLGGLVISSSLWSVLPLATLRYGVSLAANLLFACLCARRLSAGQFLDSLRWSINSMTLIGIALATAGVELAFYVDPLERSNVLGMPLVKGLYSHKIYAGLYCAMGAYLNLLCADRPRSRAWAAICVLGVLISGSSLGLVSIVTGGLAWICIRTLRQRNIRIPLATLMLFVLACLVGVVITQLSAILGLLGRDMTLTGRTGLWQWAIEFWSQRPILGWGYSGIFGDSMKAPGAIISQYDYYQAPHFHSGYLQVLAELGLAGFACVLAIAFMATARSIQAYWTSGDSVALAASIVCLMIVTTAFGMYLLLRYNELSGIFMIFCMLAYRGRITMETTRRQHA